MSSKYYRNNIKVVYQRQHKWTESSIFYFSGITPIIMSIHIRVSLILYVMKKEISYIYSALHPREIRTAKTKVKILLSLVKNMMSIQESPLVKNERNGIYLAPSDSLLSNTSIIMEIEHFDLWTKYRVSCLGKQTNDSII